MKTLPAQWSKARREIHAMKPGEERQYPAEDYMSVRAAVNALNVSETGAVWKFSSKAMASTVRRME